MCQTRLPYTVRIYESIRRIPGLTVCNLWNSLTRDTVGRLCDAVANRYLCANRNIFEQPLCMSYGETDAARRCLRTKLVGTLQYSSEYGSLYLVFGTEWKRISLVI